MSNAFKSAFVSAVIAAPLAVLAAGDHGQHHAAEQTAAAGAEMTDGEVRKVDKGAGKLTLKHAEIKSLDMPGMTMVFEVRDKAMLDKVQPGDKVKFKAVNDGGKFTVTEIQPAK